MFEHFDYKNIFKSNITSSFYHFPSRKMVEIRCMYSDAEGFYKIPCKSSYTIFSLPSLFKFTEFLSNVNFLFS